MENINNLENSITNEKVIINADFESKKIKSPQDLAKRDFDEYFEEISKKILDEATFGKSFKKEFPKNVKFPKKQYKIFTIENNTYLYRMTYKNGKLIIEVKKILNAKLEKIKPYRLIYNNKTVTPSEATIQLIFKMDNDKLSEPVILDNKAKSQHRDFNLALNKANNRILAKFDEYAFLLFMEDLNQQVQHTVLSFVNQGKVNYKDYTGRLYTNAYSENGNITPANEDGEVCFENMSITLDKSNLATLAYLYLGEYDAMSELNRLLTQVEKIYKGKIEPFLALGTAVMIIYLEDIWEVLPGFPVLYLQGSTKQGKSLIQGVIRNLFGLSNKMLTGNSTDNYIAMQCHRTNSTPVCINDYDFFQSQSAKFENNVVHFYEGGVKGKMADGTKENQMPISSTAIYSSNYLPSVKPKIFNRLLPLYYPDNGIDTSQITNNFVNDIKRSRILVEVQKFDVSYILSLIEKMEGYILSLGIFPNKDRESNNVAIAFTGIGLLECLSGYQIPNKEFLIKEYCQWYQEMIEKTTSPVDKFLDSLPMLLHKKVIQRDKDFKLKLENGRIIFSFDTQECIKLYNSYCSQEDFSLCINSKTFAYDLKASEYFIKRNNDSYKNGHQASSTFLDITDSRNGKCFYYAVTFDMNAQFSEKQKEDK